MTHIEIHALLASARIDWRESKVAKARAYALAANGSGDGTGRLGHGPLLSVLPCGIEVSKVAKARA